jgi:hypothetical protein
MKRCLVVIFVLNTLVMAIMLYAAFGPPDEPEGPEAAGRAVAAFFSFPFVIAEVVMLCLFPRSQTKREQHGSGEAADSAK